MAAAGYKVEVSCPLGCKIKLTEVLAFAVAEAGAVFVELDADRYALAMHAHMVGMHS